MTETINVRGYDNNLGQQITGQAWDAALGEVVFVVPEVAWQGMNELHRRSLGDSGPFQLPAVEGMTPVEALQTYEKASGSILAQLWVDGPSRGNQVVTSIEEYTRNGGELAGLEGVLTSAALTADRDGGGADALQLAGGMLKQFGVSEHLGGGRELAPILEAGGERLAGLGKEALEKAAESVGGREVGNQLRAELDNVLGRSGEGNHGSGGGFNLGQVIVGAFEVALGGVVAAAFPTAGGAIIHDGGTQIVEGLGQGRHGSDTPAGTEHAPGVRAVETHYEKETVTIEKPDGTKETKIKESYHTSSISTETRPKGGGGETKCWDEAGGGFDPVTGEPIPVNPCAIIMCQPLDGEFDPTEISGPHRRGDRGLEGFGPYVALEELISADPGPAGVVDVDQLFADWTLTADGAFEPPIMIANAPFDPGAEVENQIILTTPGALRGDRAAAHDIDRAIYTVRGRRGRVAIAKPAGITGTELLRAATLEINHPTMTLIIGGRGTIRIPLGP
ncbi:hypothetical protein E1263_14485 [Kribbella antibiotica]|uniref:Uncharacterized protein n=1 Tax=Kribbella antibiotica TaxID=190195 RepID=A0A4R4ZNL9_9ACTN|nr:hypothetical protein [Kribbella antibiotica]TDD59554.1 hypothetical protein E1263_14485 [Kribbella antibiotica]